ncbi:MAG: ParB/RepB/Spo0J family partition protein [Pseudonocardiales bacterium]|nr:ParB/RepB/Spo0J family partition protein [Pseudonocardiales bacterium]MBV9163487.1 ParB/RepB/Spo0J family partition protein [Pseudonocardiales bacterium]
MPPGSALPHTPGSPLPGSPVPGSQRKGGLGRGLAALIPTGPVGTAGDSASQLRHDGRSENTSTSRVTGAVYQEVPIGAIVPNPRQPRQAFDEESLAELAHSIREFGLLQPIVVRPLPAGPAIGQLPAGPAIGQSGTGRYELIMGERRWRAAQQAGLDRIPAIVRGAADDAMLRDALLENIHRVQLNPLEEAAAYQQLLEDFGVTHEQLASRIGRSRPVITNTIRLLKLPVAVQRRVAAGVLSAGHARALLSLEESFAQEALAARIVAEGLSVRATEEAVTLSRTEPCQSRPKTAAPRPMQSPGLQQLAENLSDAFDTRVKVELGRRKGRIVVEFGSVDDLERIVALMTPAR